MKLEKCDITRRYRTVSFRALVSHLVQQMVDKQIASYILRPSLSLAYPVSDIVKVEQVSCHGGSAKKVLVRATVTVLGLYGVNSDLPLEINERLISLPKPNTLIELLDVFNHVLLVNYYQRLQLYHVSPYGGNTNFANFINSVTLLKLSRMSRKNILLHLSSICDSSDLQITTENSTTSGARLGQSRLTVNHVCVRLQQLSRSYYAPVADTREIVLTGTSKSKVLSGQSRLRAKKACIVFCWITPKLRIRIRLYYAEHPRLGEGGTYLGGNSFLKCERGPFNRFAKNYSEFFL